MRQLFCLMALAFLTSACALTTATIDVPYESAGKPTPVAGANGETVAVSAADGRTAYRDRVSSKKNGFGMEMAAIIASNDIPQTVGNAIQQELGAEGYSIGPGHAQLIVEVVKFYNDFKEGMFSGDAYAEVALNVKVQGPDQTLLFSKYYEGNGTEANIMLANGSNARAALIKALGNAVHSVISDTDLQHALAKAQGSPTHAAATS